MAANVESLISHLTNSWAGGSEWLEPFSGEIFTHYSELQNNIVPHSTSWNDPEYCECLAYHYYNLALCYYRLFHKYTVDIASLNAWIKKCLDTIAKIPKEGSTDKMSILEGDAKRMFAVVSKVIETQEKHLLHCKDVIQSSNIDSQLKFVQRCITLGNLAECQHIVLALEVSNRQHKLLHQQVQSIYLIRAINTLEEALALSSLADAWTSAEQYGCLGQAYQLAGHPTLGGRYIQTARHMFESCLKDVEVPHILKQDVDDIIENEIAKFQSTLKTVKSLISEANGVNLPLAFIDSAYIDKTYADLCMELCLNEVMSCITELAACKSRSAIKGIFYSLVTVEDFNRVPFPFNQLNYYQLLVRQKLMKRENVQRFNAKLKALCVDRVLDYSKSAKQEWIFLESLVNFISSSKSYQSNIDQLQLQKLCQGSLPISVFTKLVLEIDIGQDNDVAIFLKECVQYSKIEDFLLDDMFMEIIKECIKPVEVKEIVVDGRLVVEVTGKTIVISEVVQELEDSISKNPSIEEVRFVGAEVVHIDRNLGGKTWHGMNIIILTKKVKIYGKVIWNVSGKTSSRFCAHRALDGKKRGESGENGKDGYAGESGGNVLIWTETTENLQNLTIISHGGCGSRGQDGGNGQDGKCGTGITKEDFDTTFPFGSKSTVSLETINNVVERITRNIKNFDLLQENLIEWKSDEVKLSDLFINAITKEGNIITFSYCAEDVCHQSFLLYAGTPGQPAGRGGEYGLGGEGGYGGDIMIRNPTNSRQEFNIVTNARTGDDGQRGQGGLHGCPGHNGWDMGFTATLTCTDQQTSSSSIPPITKWKPHSSSYGRNQNSNLKLSFHDTKTPERIWCPYQNHLKRANQYAEITSYPLENKDETTDKRKNDGRLNNEPQHQAKATRKKAICQESISSRYYHGGSIKNVFLNDVQLNLEETSSRTLQGIIEIKKQGMLLSAVAPLKRQDHKTTKCSYNAISTSRRCKQHNFDHLLNEFKQNSNSLDYWLRLKNLELNFEQLNQLFDIISCIAIRFPQRHMLQSEMDLANDEIILVPSIEQLLIEKYRLNALKEIAVKLNSLNHTQTFNIDLELSAQEATKFLVKCNEFDANTCSNLLCILNRRSTKMKSHHLKSIAKFDKQLQKHSEKNDHMIKMFISEIGSSEKVTPGLKHHFKNYEKHLNEQNRILSVIFNCFKFAVQMWNIKNDYTEKSLSEKLISDNFLKDIYNRFSEQLQLQYNWNGCYEDPNVLKEYSKHIEQRDPSSATYRELLACSLDTNIRLYTRNQGDLVLQNDHNPRAKQIVHILLTDSQFIQLKFDQEYLALAFEHLQKGVLFTQILSETESFKAKEQFDTYLSVQPFLSSKYLDYPFSKPVTAVNSSLCAIEEDVINQITKYFLSPIQKQEVKQRLDKIISRYIGPHKILQGILKRFISEGRHVSYEEFKFLLSYILTLAVDKHTELSIICWIISSCPQKKWSCELLLLELELYFRKPLCDKAEWRDYLSIVDNYEIILLFSEKLDWQNQNHISTRCVGDVLRLLSETSHQSIYVDDLNLTEWVPALKVPYWISKLPKLYPSSRWNQGQLEEATHYLLSLENAMAFSVVDQFVNFLSRKDTQLTPQEVVGILSRFYNEEWYMSPQMFDILSNQTTTVGQWKKEMDKKYQTNGKDRDIAQLVELVAGNIHTSKQIVEKLAQVKQSIENIGFTNYPYTEHKISTLKTNDEPKPISSLTEDDVKTWVATFKGPRETPKLEEKLAVIDRAIELKRGFKLRDTQKLAIMSLLTSEGNTLAQVSCGEGKTLIIIAMSIVKVLCGEKVDVITSSSILAKHNSNANRDIYQLFDIKVSHNCSENTDERRAAYSGSLVIYGDISNFQRDYLLDRFHGDNILGDRNFENVIVDEVDSMLLDLDHNVLYLYHDLWGFERLESVYIYIWQCLNRPIANADEMVSGLSTAAIKEAVLEELYGFIKREDLKVLDSQLDSLQVNALWESLIDSEIINYRGSILKRSIDETKLKDLLPSVFCSLGDRLRYFLKEHIERERHIIVPNYLKPFIEEHVETWINNAKSAMIMEDGHDYVVDVDRASRGKDLNPKIIVLDRNTGADKWNCQWADGLHQFLQLKHGCKLSMQSLKAVFISNVSYFKLYKHLYGLVGPLGLQLEKASLIDLYGIDFVAIPAAQTKLFSEEVPTLCATKIDWIKEIIEKVNGVIGSKNQRSALVLCETVNDVETLYQAFGGVNSDHVIAYKRDHDEFGVAEGREILTQGQIIISTNLAVCGVNIQLTNNLKKVGGLHVCLTYLPKYHRIKQQAFGRAARPGERGSGQLIIIHPDFKSNGSRYKSLHTESYIQELQLLSRMIICFKTETAYLEDCFKQFKTRYKQLSNGLKENNAPTEVKDVMLHSILDRWAFWLDKNECLKRISLGKFLTELMELKSKNSLDWPAWICTPIQAIKLGTCLSQLKKYDEAIALFDRVIDGEPLFCEAAHYYKAFALVKKTNLKEKAAREEFKKELFDAAQLFDKRIEFSLRAASIVETMKQHVSCNFIQIDSFKEQQLSICKLYKGFLQSIKDVLGHYAMPHLFVTTGIGEPLAELVYRGLLTDGILKKPIVQNYVKEDALRLISNGYGLSVETLNAVLLKIKGTEIHECEIQEVLKKEVQLPSREGFWNALVDKKILIEETQYIIINNNKLQVIDPSLLRLVDEMLVTGLLCKQRLCSKDPRHIFLYAVDDNEEITILKKIEFLDVVGRDRYNALKTSCVISCNKKACIDRSNIHSAVDLSYDSIMVQDFGSANIAEQEAKDILNELVMKKIVQQDDTDTNKYLLVGKVEKLELCSYPLYENAVKGLLTIHCIYKIALQYVLNQLDENKSPIQLPLASKPYDKLIWDLINLRVLSPVMVNPKALYNLQEKLRNKYRLTMDENEFKLLLSESRLIPKQELTRKLRDHLVEKKWISKTRKDAIKPCVFKSSQGWYQYTINQTAERQSLGQSYKNIEETLQCILDTRLHLAKENTIENIYHILYGLKNDLKSLNAENCILKPVIDLVPPGESAQLHELHSLACNGLNQYLVFKEKEVWSCNWHFNTTVEIAFVITHSAISTVRELYSIGVLTQAKHSINKGVGDLLFEAEALHSRCFSWRAYEQHKLINMFTDAVTSGPSVDVFRGVKVNNVAHKIVSPFYEIGARGYSKMAEGLTKQNSMEEFKQSIFVQVAKCARLKAIERLTFALRNVLVERVIGNCCYTVCIHMSSRIFSNIEVEFEKNTDLSTNLNQMFCRLGQDKLYELVNDLTQKYFNKSYNNEKWRATAKKLADDVLQCIYKTLKMRTKIAVTFPLDNFVKEVMTCSEGYEYLDNNALMAGDFLSYLNNEIKDALLHSEQVDENKGVDKRDCGDKEKCKNANKDGNQDDGDQDDCDQDDCDQDDGDQDDGNDKKYKDNNDNNDNTYGDTDTDKQVKYEGVANGMYVTTKEILDMLRMRLSREASHIISQYIVKPILQQMSILLHTDCGKTVRKQYGSYPEKRYTACLKKRKEAYCDSHQISLPTGDLQYYRSVLKLMAKTSSAKLLATMVKENLPMDMKCIQAVVAVIPEVLKRAGIVSQKVAVVVEGEDGTRQDFFSSGTERVIVFKLSGRGGNIESSAAGFHWLFSALAKQIPELCLNTTAEIFQAQLANCIEQSSMIQASEKNWDRFSFQDMPYDHEDTCSSCFSTSSLSTEFTRTLLLYIKTARIEPQENCSVHDGSIPFRDRSRRNSC